MLNIKKFKSPLPLIVAIFSLFLISNLPIMAYGDPQKVTFDNKSQNFSGQLEGITSGANQSISWPMPEVEPGGNPVTKTWVDTTVGFGTADLVVRKASNREEHAMKNFKLQPSEKFNDGQIWTPFAEVDRAHGEKTTPGFKLEAVFDTPEDFALAQGQYYANIHITLIEETVNL